MTQFANRKRLIGLTTAALIAGTALTGVLNAAPGAELSARQAEAAIAKGKSSKAIAFAEQAVTSEPDNARYRAVLGSAYLGAGRFISAAAAFEDAAALGDASPRTMLSLALAQTGSNQTALALASLDRASDSIAPADLGLAYALAGDPQRGVAVLSDAIRNGENTTKIRQNLAYALALMGDWRQSRIMASMDIPEEQVGARMQEWAAMAQSGAFQHRVAALLNAPVLDQDPGRPAALALNGAPVQQASAAEEVPPPPPYRGGELPAIGSASQQASHSVPPQAEYTPVARAQASPAPAGYTQIAAEPAARAAAQPTTFETAFAADIQQAATPAAMIAASIQFVSQPVVQHIPARYAANIPSVRRAVPAPYAPHSNRSAPVAARGGKQGIQLGSFLSEQSARQATVAYARKHRGLDRNQMRIAKANVNGKTYWRVYATGLSVADARAMCSTLKASGQSCLTTSKTA